MNQEVEWTTNSIFSFINDLQNLPILWDSKITHQKLGRTKNDIWLELATKYNCTSDELKRKWQSLQAAYRREKMKEMSSGGQYRSRWFAFNHMSFVGDRYRPRKLIYYSGKADPFEAKEEAGTEGDEESPFVGIDDPGEEEQEREEEIQFVDAEVMQQNTESSSASRSFMTAKANPFKKMKFQYDDFSMRDSYHIQRGTMHQEERNECSIFGEFVAKKLSKLDDRTSAIVQHHIHNILFQAEMGQMNDSITSDLGSSPNSVHSPSSTNHHASVYEVPQSQ